MRTVALYNSHPNHTGAALTLTLTLRVRSIEACRGRRGLTHRSVGVA